MRVWSPDDPGDYQFARASLRGSWSASSGLCSECVASSQDRIQPLILEWEPDSDVVGDFVWPGFGSDIAITERVVQALKSCRGFDPGPVKMLQDPHLKRPSGSRRGKRRVWLPYQGPALYDLWVTQMVHVDLERSSVRLMKECGTCGRHQYAVDGIEKWEIGWDKERRQSVKTHLLRTQGLGLYISGDALGEYAFFRTYEFPAWILCTERVKELVESESFTNVRFLEVGETF